jgi:hypothetical protein
MRKTTILAAVILLGVFSLVRAEVQEPPPAPVKPCRGSPWLVGAEIAGINLAVWAIPHYTIAPSYTYISWETMRENFRDGFEWDRSRYFVNFYHHPYHGYLYFNAGRANGFNYWGSALATLGGSLMWEMVMENNRPSINDLVTTTAGGCVYGEIGYRLSALVMSRRGHGIGRAWREALGVILNPIGGLHRLLHRRRVGESRPFTGSVDGARLKGEVILSGPVVTRSAELSGARAVPIVGFSLDYGDPAGKDFFGQPFGEFTVKGQLRWGPDRPHLSLFLNGALLGKRLAAPGADSHFIGLYQHYEYYGFDTLRVCGTSLSGGWSSRIGLAPRLGLTASARLGALGLGGSDDFYDDSGERRSYNFATGWLAVAEVAVNSRGRERASLAWRHYGLRALAVSGGRAGRESWNILQAKASLPVWRRFAVGLVAEYCRRVFAYRDHPRGDRRLVEVRAFAAWQF